MTPRGEQYPGPEHSNNTSNMNPNAIAIIGTKDNGGCFVDHAATLREARSRAAWYRRRGYKVRTMPQEKWIAICAQPC